MPRTNSVDELIEEEPYYTTSQGAAFLGDSRNLLEELPEKSIDLIVTSPPFSLLHKKEYGNKDQDEYIDWFMDFADKVYPVLKEDGSFVVDIGGSWTKGVPTKSLYQFKLLIRMIEQGPYHLAQDFYWHNPAKLPTPAQWVTIERIRVKDAVNNIWWFSKTERPEADNKRVLQEYSDAQKKLMEDGYRDKERPSGHNISDTFDEPEQDGSIPPNMLEIGNTASNTHYMQACKSLDIEPHPARFPRQLPEFFIKLLTENPPYEDDTPVVLDIFAGSNVTGKAAEDLGRKWLSFEAEEEYVSQSELRFMSMEEIEKHDDQSELKQFEPVQD